MEIKFYVYSSSSGKKFGDRSARKEVDSFLPPSDNIHWTQKADEIIKKMKYIHQNKDLENKWNEVVKSNK